MSQDMVELKISKPNETGLLIEYVAPVAQISALKSTHYHQMLKSMRREGVSRKRASETADGICIQVTHGSCDVELEDGRYRIRCFTAESGFLALLFNFPGRTIRQLSLGQTSIEFGARFTFDDWLGNKSPLARHIGLDGTFEVNGTPPPYTGTIPSKGGNLQQPEERLRGVSFGRQQDTSLVLANAPCIQSKAE
ncbi:hypothetical protein BDV30DRAFT_236221 [Aspergillus minisclerotigenes]|uniref:Uncharacterized protein n=1 Tax=Aspergillus minisclerotigenes TaxID=656917 RepID=A0A5N6JBE8_9EURO|nr:hypothetical protein BDV30DRAFT_236221 [Aspergillus minisclerotigenes]